MRVSVIYLTQDYSLKLTQNELNNSLTIFLNIFYSYFKIIQVLINLLAYWDFYLIETTQVHKRDENEIGNGEL